MPIYFYSNSDQYFWLSNFSPHGVEMDGAWWPTVEHYFQAQKFHDAAYREKIRLARSPKDAKSLGLSRAHPLRADWEQVKEDIMFAACLKKFHTHPEIAHKLLETGDEILIENAPNVYFWGAGRTGTGKNKLGQILVRVHTQLAPR